MSSIYFQTPKKPAFYDKLITVISLLIIIVSLYLTCYMLFFRTVDVDVTKAAEITYHGESGSASVKVSNKNQDYNQRIQEFMDSITYSVTPSRRLKNGEVIRISAKYDNELASRFHINPINAVKSVKIENLPIRFQSVKDIGMPLLKKINDKAKTYFNKNMDSILNEAFISFHISAKPILVSSKRIYRVFLDSRHNLAKDKIIDIYAITANGAVNTSSQEEKLEMKDETIYYMITYNEMNTSNQVLDENVYGEKLMIKNNVDLSKEKEFMEYIKAKYNNIYEIILLKDEILK